MDACCLIEKSELYCVLCSVFQATALSTAFSTHLGKGWMVKQLEGIRFGLCIYVFVSIFQIFYPILYAGVRFTQIFSRLIKNYTLSYIHFFLLFMAVSPGSPRARMVRFGVSRSTLPLRAPWIAVAFLRCNSLLIKNAERISPLHI